jgi:hypothetical protein
MGGGELLYSFEGKQNRYAMEASRASRSISAQGIFM